MNAGIVVVGRGLFGSIIARGLRDRGHDVITIDDDRVWSGSKPAACLMKPSWYSSLGPKIYGPALDMLGRLYNMQTVKFDVGRLMNVESYWIDPASILTPIDSHDFDGRVHAIHQAGDTWQVDWSEPRGYRSTILARRVIICTGIWGNELSKIEGLEPRIGVAFEYDDPEQATRPFINVWAPYRQLVAFHRAPGKLWVGDGTALKAMELKDEQLDKCEARCNDAVGQTNPVRRLVGIRPYVKGHKPAYLAEHLPGLWVANGGAKNGTLAAGWCAAQLRERI